MPSYYFSFAGIVLQIESDRQLRAEESCLPFLTDPTEPDVQAVFACVDRLSQHLTVELHRGPVWKDGVNAECAPLRLFYDRPGSKEPYASAVWDGERKNVRIEYLSSEGGRFSSLMNCFFYLDMERVLICNDCLWPHASCVETQLGGILFSGVSGIGKSTQAELWCRYRNARRINGDRPILRKSNGRWQAWGAPYAGSSRCYVNDCCDVAAIVMLRQEKSCSLKRLRGMDAFREVWKGLALHSWDREYVDRASALTLELIGQIPVYCLGCTPDEEAVRFLEQELGKDVAP